MGFVWDLLGYRVDGTSHPQPHAPFPGEGRSHDPAARTPHSPRSSFHAPTRQLCIRFSRDGVQAHKGSPQKLQENYGVLGNNFATRGQGLMICGFGLAIWDCWLRPTLSLHTDRARLVQCRRYHPVQKCLRSLALQNPAALAHARYRMLPNPQQEPFAQFRPARRRAWSAGAVRTCPPR